MQKAIDDGGKMIKEIPLSDFTRFASIEQNAYAPHFKGTRDERDQLADIFKKLTKDDSIIAFGYYEEDLIGAVLYYEFKQNFHGQMIVTAGIGSLAVDLLHKKKHVAQKLIKYCLEYAKNRDLELFYLYPFATDFYRNFGFGYSTKMVTYHIKPEDFIYKGDLKALKWIDKEDYQKVFDYHDQVAHERNGMMLKAFGDKYRLDRMDKAKVIVHETDQINGYMIFTQESLKLNDDMAQKIVVHEALYSRQALMDFIAFLHVQKDQIDYIEWASHDQNLHFLCNHISFASEPKTLDIIALKSSENAVGLMPLVLHPDKLLKRLSRKTNENVQFKIHYPKAAVEVYNIHFSKNFIEIELSINEFSSWITGAITLEELYQSHLLSCNKVEMLEKLDHDFNFKKPMNLGRF